jgi:hypothetical protein
MIVTPKNYLTSQDSHSPPSCLCGTRREVVFGWVKKFSSALPRLVAASGEPRRRGPQKIINRHTLFEGCGSAMAP